MTAEFTPVFVLLRPCRPSTVGRFVVSVVVDAVKRQTGWLLAHVSEKVFKAVQPSVAHGYAAATVVFKFFDVWIVAARFHVGPRAECGAPSTDSVSMGASGAQDVTHEATTGPRIAVLQVSGGCGSSFRAAVASAMPHDTQFFTGSDPVRYTDNRKTVKPVACDINETGHGDLASGLLRQVAVRPCRV
jgi:hypothetical protein